MNEPAIGLADGRAAAAEGALPPARAGSTNQQQDALRSSVKSALGGPALSGFRALDLSYTLRDAAFIHLLLVGVIAVTIYAHARWGVVALAGAPVLALLTGVAFNWINVQVHEASHFLLLRSKRSNDVYCNLVLGAFALQDVETYRATHGMHHAHLHTERDPDLWVYTSNVGSVRSVLRGILDDLLLRTILRRKLQVDAFILAAGMKRGSAPRYTAFAKLLAQGLVLAAFIWGCGIWGVAYYLAIYLYGLLAIFPVLIRIRTVVQHFAPTFDANPESRFVSRTTVAPLLEFVLIGARMDYHFEHHLFPNLPYYNLSKMHRTLRAAGFFESVLATSGQALHTDDYLKTYLGLSLRRG
jgi:fatty acid desaturase